MIYIINYTAKGGIEIEARDLKEAHNKAFDKLQKVWGDNFEIDELEEVE